MDKLLELFESINDHSIYEIFETSFDPVVVTDANWKEGIKILFVNEAFCNATGYTKEFMIGKNPKVLQGKDSNYEILQELKEELQAGRKFVGQTTNYNAKREPYHVKWSIVPLFDKRDNIVAYVSFQKILEKRALSIKHEKLLSTIVDVSKNLILVTDLEGFIVYINNSFSQKLGYAKNELAGRHSRVLKSNIQSQDFYKKMWQSIIKTGKFSGTFVSRKKDGTLFYDEKDISTIFDDDGNPLFYVSISQDITKQVEKEKQLESQVFTDQLTKLFNRRKYDLMIKAKIAEYHKHGKVFSIILIDIDHFKSINDTYGHDKGDSILKGLASLLQQNIRSEDMLFRWGGEEFTLLVNISQVDAKLLAEKLRAKIEHTPLASIDITASFGVAQIQEQMIESELFSRCDKALYKAKSSGRNQVQVALD